MEKSEIIVRGLYDEVSEFWKGFAAVQKGGKWGLVNEQGEEFWD